MYHISPNAVEAGLTPPLLYGATAHVSRCRRYWSSADSF